MSAARGCAPSKPDDHPPFGASEYADCSPPYKNVSVVSFHS